MTNCFSINFKVFTNNNHLNFTKIHFKFITDKKAKIKKLLSLVSDYHFRGSDQSEYRKFVTRKFDYLRISMVSINFQVFTNNNQLKAMSYHAIFLATGNAILLLRDVNL